MNNGLKTFLCRQNEFGDLVIHTEINGISKNSNKNLIALYFTSPRDYEIKDELNKRILISKNPFTYEKALLFKKNNMY
jgi:hypothetical protein